MFAVIKTGGRQYKVSVGETLEVNRLPVEDGTEVKFEEVLLISDAERSMVGTPLLENAVVLATAIRQKRGKKLIVFKYKSKKRYRHRRGHRQELTFLTIDDIVADGISLVTGEAPEAKEVPVEEEAGDAINLVVTLAEEATEAEVETPAVETPTVETPTAETETPAPAVEPEKKTTRRRRTAKAEPTESEPTAESESTSENKTEE